MSGGHGHGHQHAHGHSDDSHDDHDEAKTIVTRSGALTLQVFEDGVPPHFRLYADTAPLPAAELATIETIRSGGTRQIFKMAAKEMYLESVEEIPEPHAFTADVKIGEDIHPALFEEHEHAGAATDSDNNMRAAVVHVIADAAVSVLVIGLILAKLFGWLWMDPLAGIIGAFVIASWAFGLIKVTGGILLDMSPDRMMAEKLRQAIEVDGDELSDLHLWRLGPGHLGAIVSVDTKERRGPDFYKAKLARFRSLSHLTVEVQRTS